MAERAALQVGAATVRAAVERPLGYLPGESVHATVTLLVARDAAADLPAHTVRASCALRPALRVARRGPGSSAAAQAPAALMMVRRHGVHAPRRAVGGTVYRRGAPGRLLGDTQRTARGRRGAAQSAPCFNVCPRCTAPDEVCGCTTRRLRAGRALHVSHAARHAVLRCGLLHQRLRTPRACETCWPGLRRAALLTLCTAAGAACSLTPGERRSFHVQFTLPHELPPSFRGTFARCGPRHTADVRSRRALTPDATHAAALHTR